MACPGTVSRLRGEKVVGANDRRGVSHIYTLQINIGTCCTRTHDPEVMAVTARAFVVSLFPGEPFLRLLQSSVRDISALVNDLKAVYQISLKGRDSTGTLSSCRVQRGRSLEHSRI